MPSAFYDDVFAVPVGHKHPKRGGTPRSADDLEFSEYGRSTHIRSGWYLAPALIVVPALLLMLL